MRARKDNALASKKTESHPRNQPNKEESNPTKESGQRSKEYIPPPDGFGDQPDSGDLMRESNERLISFIEKVRVRSGAKDLAGALPDTLTSTSTITVQCRSAVVAEIE